MYTAAMRTVAALHDLPEDCFTGKSPRINASTNTAAAGRSEIHTQNLLGHASVQSTMQYQNLIASSRVGMDGRVTNPKWTPGSTVTALADPCMFTVDDLKRSVNQSMFRKQAKDRQERAFHDVPYVHGPFSADYTNPGYCYDPVTASFVAPDESVEPAITSAAPITAATAPRKLRIKKPINLKSEKNRISQSINDYMVADDHEIERRVRAGTWVPRFKESDLKFPTEGEEQEEEEAEGQKETGESESSEDGGRLL
jgi:hypothetical protein